jgi:hypothetical protein
MPGQLLRTAKRASPSHACRILRIASRGISVTADDLPGSAIGKWQRLVRLDSRFSGKMMVSAAASLQVLLSLENGGRSAYVV